MSGPAGIPEQRLGATHTCDWTDRGCRPLLGPQLGPQRGNGVPETMTPAIKDCLPVLAFAYQSKRRTVIGRHE